MNRKVIISLGLLAIALTIAGITADGDTTPPAAAEIADPSGPEAADNSGPPTGALPIQLNAVEREDDSGSSGEFKCYKYACGEKVFIDGTSRVKCEEIPKETISCDTNITTCEWKKSKGVNFLYGPLDFVAGKCAEAGSPNSGCVDKVVMGEGGFNGTTNTCHCSTSLCNGPFALTSSVSSSSRLLSSFFAAFFLAIMINIL